MRDWIVGYRKAAKNAGPGVAQTELHRFEEEAGEGLPDELRDLYQEMNGGGVWEGGVLFPFRPQPPEEGRSAERRASGAWLFGAKGDSQELFATRRRALAAEAGEAAIPEWVQALEGDLWLFGAKDEQKQQLRVYRTLE